MKTTTNNTKKRTLRDSNVFKLIIILLFIAGSIWSSPSAKPLHKVSDSLVCLQIQGKIIIYGESADNECIVELIDENGNIDTLVLRDNKLKFRFMLERNSIYAIRVSKKGYMSKYVSVNTEINDERDVIHRFVFETPLLKKEASMHLNSDATDLPIAIIHFDSKKNCFNYDREYTANVKKQLRKGRSIGQKKTLISTHSKTLATAYTN